MERPADKSTLKFLFNGLMLMLNGFNCTEGNGKETFDFYYDAYRFTMQLDKNGICLANNVDIYDELDNYKGNYSLNEVFVTGIDTGN